MDGDRERAREEKSAGTRDGAEKGEKVSARESDGGEGRGEAPRGEGRRKLEEGARGTIGREKWSGNPTRSRRRDDRSGRQER